MGAAERAEVAKVLAAAGLELASWWLLGSLYWDAIARTQYLTQLQVLGAATGVSVALSTVTRLGNRIADVRSGAWREALQAKPSVAVEDPAGLELEAMSLLQLAIAQAQAKATGEWTRKAEIEARIVSLIEVERHEAFQACENRRQRRKLEQAS